MINVTWRLALVSTALLAAAACSKGQGSAGRGNEMSDSMGMSNMSSMSGMSDGIEYTIVLKSRWTKDRFPFEYPAAGALTGPHFSGLIGASHNGSYTVFATDSRPTPGLERLSEEGKHTPLDEEIRAALAAGSAGVLFESGPLRDFGGSLVATVRVDADHPLVSLVAMIAPSPDWFTGVSNVNLRENGEWVSSRILDLWAYDSGGDDGTTYKAADQDNNPKKPTSRATSRHFAPSGTPLAVGSVTITRR